MSNRTVSMMLTPEEAERIEQDRINTVFNNGVRSGMNSALGIVLSTIPVGAIKSEVVNRIEQVRDGVPK